MYVVTEIFYNILKHFRADILISVLLRIETGIKLLYTLYKYIYIYLSHLWDQGALLKKLFF